MQLRCCPRGPGKNSKHWSQVYTYRLRPHCFRFQSILSASASSPCRCGNASCSSSLLHTSVRHRRFAESVPVADAVVANLLAAQLLCFRIWRHAAFLGIERVFPLCHQDVFAQWPFKSKWTNDSKANITPATSNLVNDLIRATSQMRARYHISSVVAQ